MFILEDFNGYRYMVTPDPEKHVTGSLAIW